jgi:hypothetical protein
VLWLAYQPYCINLPQEVREQLFLGKNKTSPRPAGFMAPRGELLC